MIGIVSWICGASKIIWTCLKNKENRDKNNIIHTSSSKSFQQRSAEEKEKTGHSPSRIELFDITHVQANGQAVNEPTQDALVALRNLTTQVNEGALQISQDQMFMEVFGPERHGRVRGYGVGVTPTKLWVPPHLECMILRSDSKNLNKKR